MIIGLTGAARSGKDTVASMLTEFLAASYPMRATRSRSNATGVIQVQIAGPLKAFCREVFDWTTEHTDGALKDIPDQRYPNARGYLTPRQAMQSLGDDWSTPLYEPIWAVLAARKAKQYWDEGNVVFVTDCRFLRDIRAVREVGGIIVQVHRDTGAGLTGAAAQHRGEVERNLPEFQALVTHHIYNHGSLDDLRAACLEILLPLVPPKYR